MSSIVSNEMSPKNDSVESEQINSEHRNVAAELNDSHPDNVSSVVLSDEKLESTSIVLETNEKQETSTVDPSLVTPVKSVETVDEVRSWIKKTLSGTGFKRKPYAGATSVPIVDEDEGLVRRKSWSFRITPDGTPNKGRSRSNSRTNSIRLSASKDKEDNHHTTEPDLIAAAETKNSISSYVISTDDIPDLDEEQNNTLQPELGENTPFNGNKDTGADSSNDKSNNSNGNGNGNNDNTSDSTNHDANNTNKELFAETEESKVVVDEVVPIVVPVVVALENLENSISTDENKEKDEKPEKSEEHTVSSTIDTTTAAPTTAPTTVPATPIKSTEPEGSLSLSLPHSHTTPAPSSDSASATTTPISTATTTATTNNNTNTANTPVVNTPVTATESRPISVSLKRTIVTSPTPVVAAKPVESYDRTKLRSVAELKKQESLALEKESSGRNNMVEKEHVVIKAVPAPVPVVEEKKEVVLEFFEFEVLVERNLTKKFDGLVLGELERHLSDTDFKKHFGVTKTEFYKQPAWKQKDKKKKLGLF